MTTALRFGEKIAFSIGKTTNPLMKRSAPCNSRRSSSSLVAASYMNKDRLPTTAASIAFTSTTLCNAGIAHADEQTTVDTAVTSIVEIVKSAGEAVKSGIAITEQGIEAAKEAYQTVSPVVQATTDVVAPVVKAGVNVAVPVVKSTLDAATQAVTSAKPSLEKALSDSGVDVGAVSAAERAAEQAIISTKPLLESFVHFVTTSSPTVLAECTLGLVAAYYLVPPLLKAGVGALRGYAGDVTPAAALDALSSRGDTVLVDVRSARDKESQGIPDVPNSGSKLVELEYAIIEDRLVRGQLRNLGALETKITALQIAALKRLSKGTTVFLLDKNGSVAKAIAKELGARGYSRVFVVSGGFSGWARDRLGTKLSNTVSRVEVLLPGFGTGSTASGGSTTSGGSRRQLPPQQTRKALPSGR